MIYVILGEQRGEPADVMGTQRFREGGDQRVFGSSRAGSPS
jgi:hypothetical protein